MKTPTKVLLLALGAVLLVGLAGCGDVVSALLAPYGYVVDDAGNGLSGITVTLSSGTTVVDTATTSSSGFFSFPDVDAGSYTMSAADPATSDAWQFDDKAVTVSSAGQNLGIIRGYKAFAITGTVVDSRSDTEPLAGVEGVDVTLTPRSGVGSTYLATTGAGGSFTVAIGDKSSFVPGDYDVTGSIAGYFVAPKTVSLTTASGDVGDVQAFALSPSEEYGLSFILVWESALDLDLHLSFPIDDPGETNVFSASATPYFDDFSGSRDRKYYANKATIYTYGGHDAVYMDRDDTDGYGPETMNLIWITQGSVCGSASTTDTGTGLSVFEAAGNPYSYYGSAELYVNAWASGTYLTQLSGEVATSARAKVYCIQTLPINESLPEGTADNQKARLLGVYTIPEYTTIKSASVLRVLMFKDDDAVEWFMIVPDITVIPDGPNVDLTFRGVDVSPGIIGVRGKASR